jgi:hypothetical protein
LTLLLLAGAGFMMRAFFRAYSARPNVNTLHVWAMRVALPRVTYRTPEQRVAFVRQLEERLGRLDPLAAGSIASAVPFEPAPRREFAIDGRAPVSGSRPPSVSTVTIGGRFFETLNLHLARGRQLTNLDGTPGREAAIVNERFAAVYFPGEDPIGHRIRLTDPNADAASPPWVTVVGVSPTVRRDVTSDGDPIVYLPYGAQPSEQWAVLVRAAREPDAVVPLVREEVRALDPDLPLFDIRTLDEGLAFCRLTARHTSIRSVHCGTSSHSAHPWKRSHDADESILQLKDRLTCGVGRRAFSSLCVG